MMMSCVYIGVKCEYLAADSLQFEHILEYFSKVG